MQIKDYMKKNVVSIRTTTTIGEAAAVIVEKHVGILPVVDEQGKPVGVVRLERSARTGNARFHQFGGGL